MKMVLSQNYFTFLNNVYEPTKGVVMDSPISSIVIEIFLQFYEDRFIEHLLETKNITLFTRYIDDILIGYDTTKIDAELITSSMNHIHEIVMFSPTHENNGQINFLDLLLIQKESSIEVGVYCKPVTTDK